MKRFIEGQARDHSALLPEFPEDCSDKNNPVRVIDAFVEAIELSSLGLSGVDPKATGRPAYHPAILLKLYPRRITSFPAGGQLTVRRFD